LAGGYLGFAPISARQEITPEALSQVAILTSPKALPQPTIPAVAPEVGSEH
jgi:hypothetical protein